MFHKRGAGKKKSLTDPVKIIPFPNQNLRERTNKPAAKPSIRKETKPVVHKPEPKVMEAPSGKLTGSNLSIKKILEKKSADPSDDAVDRSTLPRNAYALDDFKMEWRKFAFMMKNEGKETFYNAMIKREPRRVQEDEFVMEVDNQVQIDYIRPNLSDLVEHVRKALKNFDIHVNIEITKNPDQEVKYQTGKDKFAALARKNPNLHSLKNTFNLDIEY